MSVLPLLGHSGRGRFGHLDRRTYVRV